MFENKARTIGRLSVTSIYYYNFIHVQSSDLSFKQHVRKSNFLIAKYTSKD